ncbi:MAG: PBP1A family penicillin-binding protein [Pseudobdellovibrionaceae bacterium]|nr:MAG: PBP1A family penicillin-binding protein [Pseudobdellovibrionaceae bacterium]
MTGNWFVPPLEIFSAPESVVGGQKLQIESLIAYLREQNYRQRSPDQKLFEKDFSLWPFDFCQSHLSVALPADVTTCLALKTRKRDFGPQRKSQTYLLAWTGNDTVTHLFSGEPFQQNELITLPPQLFAQFYGDKPILRRIVSVDVTPLQCLQAVTAIEDRNFLEHSGVSFGGMIRAALRNILRGRIAQGGSTITQQLIKNYFLTPERTFKRKIKEVFMALILESYVSKDTILENYLNVIYMGQNGPFQVRGFGAASEHYFHRPLENLELDQCALLAAIVNCPGCYNPFSKPDAAIKRRNKVLGDMLELNMITSSQFEEANKAPLPKKSLRTLSDPAPYFVQAVQRELGRLKIDQNQGLRVFTTLNQQAQEVAQTTVLKEVERLEASKALSKYKDQGKDLEALLVSVDLKSNGILALVGGRKYKTTQYNRVLDAHRQVGSIMKPIVYLTALESVSPEGSSYTPLTLLPNQPFTYEYEGQSWSPKNYSDEYSDNVPLFFALKNSINIPTAQLGLSVGLTNIIDVARRLGIQSPIDPLPALTLGAYELYPWEVAQAYSTIAHFGNRQPIHYIASVESMAGQNLFKHDERSQPAVAAPSAAVLVGMLKQTMLTGTARSVQWRGFQHPAAGKTGTTSDTRDAWFVGFTPYVLTIVWVGYDDNTPHGLTGASGALPIWAEFMKSYATRYPPEDFKWPEGTTQYFYSPNDLQMVVPNLEENELKQDIPLIFRTGNEPTFGQ